MQTKIKDATVVHFEAVEDADWVPIGDRLIIPERFYAVILPDDPKLPACSINYVVEHGRAHVAELLCERRDSGPPITGTTLRDLPIGSYTKEATRMVTRRLVQDGDEVRAVPVYGERMPQEWRDDGVPVYGRESVVVPETARFDAQYARLTSGPRHRGPLREEDLRSVAGVYRGAISQGEPPTRAVAARFGVARSTAGRWIAEARRRGVLGRAPRPRMAGEITQED